MLRPLALAAALLVATDLAACPGGAMPQAAGATLSGPIDQGLFSRAVTAEINRYRCEAGVGPVAPSASVTRAAIHHSTWMARTDRMSHASTEPGRRTLGARLAQAGVRYRRAAENIGFMPACGDSYAGLARRIVAAWSRSPGHRRNILDPALAHSGAAAVPRGDCRRVYMTSAFAG